MTEKISIQDSSGNLFADLGLPNPDKLLVKAELVCRISEIINKQNMTQAQAAQLLGVEQFHISALIKVRLSDFSTERLFQFLDILGCDGAN